MRNDHSVRYYRVMPQLRNTTALSSQYSLRDGWLILVAQDLASVEQRSISILQALSSFLQTPNSYYKHHYYLVDWRRMQMNS